MTNITLPPLPPTAYALAREGDGYSPDRLLNEAGYSEGQVRVYAIAAVLAERQWRNTVDDMLSVCHMVASDDPRESINRLINWHVSVALDPAVSSDAAALVASERERCARIVEDYCGAWSDQGYALASAIRAARPAGEK